MAQLKIYNDITTEEDKVINQFFGMDGVCYKDVDTFCDSIPKDDENIEIRLHCDGGSVLEGWAIYDRLRATGMKITTIVEGNAASMATIVMMAAPIERRLAYKSSRICIHNPWIALDDMAANADDLQKMANDLQDEQRRMVDLYVDRCDGKATAEEIQLLMNEDKYISAQKALEMGLIGRIIEPASAKKQTNIINQSKSMEKVEVKKSLLAKVLGKLGLKSLDEVEMMGMDLNTADGQVLTVEREEGEPQVGDAANPDGEFKMPDGSTIVVKDGVITEINTDEAAGDGAEESDDKKGEQDDGTQEETDPAESETSELEQKVAELEQRIAELEQQLADANAKAKTTEDLKVLNAVKMAGGADKVFSHIQSNYTPATKQSNCEKVEKAERNTLREKIEAIKNSRNINNQK